MSELPSIHDLGPTSSAVSLWRIGGKIHVTAVMKATFALAADGAMQLASPEPVLPSQLVPYLPDTDVSFVGHAHLRDPRAPVRLALYADETPRRMLVDKETTCDPSARLDASSPGGIIAVPCDAFAPRCPSTEHPRVLVARPGGSDTLIPVVSSSFDWSTFWAVAADQRCEWLRGSEWLVLEGLLAEHERLETQLPSGTAELRVSIPPVAEGPRRLSVRADTLAIDGERGLCSVIWRGSFPVDDDARISGVSIWSHLQLPGEDKMVWPPSDELPQSLAPELEARQALFRPRAESAPAAAAAKPVAPPATEPFAAPAAAFRAPPMGADEPPDEADTVQLAAPPVGTVRLSDEQHAHAGSREALPFDPAGDDTGTVRLGDYALNQANADDTGTVHLGDHALDEAAKRPATPFPEDTEATGSPPAKPPRSNDD